MPLTIACIAICSALPGYCSDSTDILKKNIAYGCVGGKELLGVVGFERIFSQSKKLKWSASLGIQPFQLPSKLSVPVAVSAFTKGPLHHLEVDLMATFYMDKYHPYDGGWKDDFNKQLYISSFVGYRLQGRGWFMFKAGIGPQLLLDPPSDYISAFKTKLIPLSGYAAVGISF